MIDSTLKNIITEYIYNSSILCSNGYWDGKNKKCICYFGFILDNNNKCKLIPKFNKVKHLRNMLSNETLSNFSNYVKDETADYFIIIVALIVIICGILFIKYLYKKWKRINKKEENEDIELSAQARFEKNFLNSKTFSFIPVTSPIKVKDIKDIKDTKSQNPERNIDEKNNNKKNNDELRIEQPGKIKNDNISCFSVSNGDEKINVKKSN